MAAITRPTFVEGQVLGAADLEALGAGARFESAVHERSEHVWGVAQGLALVPGAGKKDAAGKDYIEPTLEAGVAIAPNGRRIVVPEPVALRDLDFRAQGVFTSNDDSTTQFPVYIAAIDVPRPQTRALGGCGTGTASRTEETYQIEYGAPGSEERVLRPTAAVAVDAAPDPGRKVLVGFVTWNKEAVSNTGRFFGVATASSVGAVRYAGVRASSVIGHAGAVVVQTSDKDPRFVLGMVEDGLGGCKLSFGRQQGTAAPSALFSVDEKGNLSFAGKLNPELPARVLSVASGTIFHGLKIPLPAGVDEAAVTAGRFTLHVSVRPIVRLRTIAGVTTYAHPMVCQVDANRVVTSITRWLTAAGANIAFTGPSRCSYQVIAVPS